MFVRRATSGFQYGLGFLFARDFYSKSKELGPSILIIILCIAGPIAISLYFFRKINNVVYSILQGETKDTEEHVSIFKRFLSIIILPFMIIILLFVTPPLLYIVDWLFYIIIAIFFWILNASYSIVALLYSDDSFSVIFVQIQEYAFHTMLTLTGNTFPLLFTYLGGIINQSQELIDLISNYTGINISTINVYSQYHHLEKGQYVVGYWGDVKDWDKDYILDNNFLHYFFDGSKSTGSITVLLIILFLLEPIFNFFKYKRIIKARDK